VTTKSWFKTDGDGKKTLERQSEHQGLQKRQKKRKARLRTEGKKIIWKRGRQRAGKEFTAVPIQRAAKGTF